MGDKLQGTFWEEQGAMATDQDIDVAAIYKFGSVWFSLCGGFPSAQSP